MSSTGADSGIEGVPGWITIELSVAAMTVSAMVPLTAPLLAVMVAAPAATAVTRPSTLEFESEATLGAARDGVRTMDLGGEASTTDVVDEVLARLR